MDHAPRDARVNEDGYREDMRRLLTPKWLAWHASAVVAALVMVRLGLWQWHRSEVTHSAQNLGYALQWPAFAVFALVVWFRVCRDAVKGPPEAKPVKVRTPRPGPAAAVVPVTDEEDPELAAYNRYLTRLNSEAGSAQRDRARPGRPAAERGTR
jgi:DNA-binding transcriptional regulator of glucitol operon